MSWRDYTEQQARALTPNQVAWRKKKYLEQMSDRELMDWSIGKNMVLLHASECPSMDEYSEFVWMPRPKEWG
jgi:hypothetical protein